MLGLTMIGENLSVDALAGAPPIVPSVAIQEATADAEVFATASRAAWTWRDYA